MGVILQNSQAPIRDSAPSSVERADLSSTPYCRRAAKSHAGFQRPVTCPFFHRLTSRKRSARVTSDCTAPRYPFREIPYVVIIVRCGARLVFVEDENTATFLYNPPPTQTSPHHVLICHLGPRILCLTDRLRVKATDGQTRITNDPRASASPRRASHFNPCQGGRHIDTPS